MAYVKYTREMLAQAVTASESMSDVLRFLGLRLNGGSHAHLRRRLDHFGIDTSHFLGRAHARGKANPRRRRPDEILVVRPADAKRQSPTTLRRALEQTGRPYRCAACDVGAEWNGLPLTLQVDHVDGRFHDCRAANLRFLCPNCHTQTATYAGRNRPRRPVAVIRVDERGNPVTAPTRPVTGDDRAEILARVSQGELTVTDAARMIGCSRSHLYQLARRLSERGSLAAAPRRTRHPPDNRGAVIAFAVANPSLGPRKIAAALRARHPDPLDISATTIGTLLTRAGLNTRAARTTARDLTSERDFSPEGKGEGTTATSQISLPGSVSTSIV